MNDTEMHEAARRNVLLCLGEDDPDTQSRVLNDLRSREGMTYDEIAKMPPWELGSLNDRYSWTSD